VGVRKELWRVVVSWGVGDAGVVEGIRFGGWGVMARGCRGCQSVRVGYGLGVMPRVKGCWSVKVRGRDVICVLRMQGLWEGSGWDLRCFNKRL